MTFIKSPVAFLFGQQCLNLLFLILPFFLAFSTIGQASGTDESQIKDVAITHLRRINSITSCDQIVDLCQERGFKVGAELGVQIGVFAEKNLNKWKTCEKYYLIDLWKHQENYEDFANAEDSVQLANMKATETRLQRFGKVPVLIQNSTINASYLIPDESLDFVYVDARHDYCGTYDDIEAYWPKLKKGGIMAGHDYLLANQVKGQDWSLCQNGTRNEGAVKGAVDDFAAKRGIKVYSTREEWKCWIYSPKGVHVHHMHHVNGREG